MPQSTCKKKKEEKEEKKRLEQVIALQSGAGRAGVGFHMKCIQLLWKEKKTELINKLSDCK